MNGAEFAELVRASRSYRRFDETNRVTMDELRSYVDTARFAPTGNNSQQLRFHLMTSEVDVAACQSCHGWAALFKDWDGPIAGERPTAYIAICAPKGAGKNPIRNLDAGIAAQTIMLAARAEGRTGCMIKSYRPILDEKIGVADKGYETLVLLAFGAPGERIELEDVEDEHGLAYWRDESDVHHVPKLCLDELLV